jgi:SAM-dependent methyltransferase
MLLGAAVAALWVYLAGGLRFLRALAQVHPGYIVLLVASTGFCVFIRFVRWQFLLRRAGIRIPIRPSFSIFLASLVGTATPAYSGEVIRTLFVRKKFRVPIRMTLPVLVFERLCDVAALALIAFITSDEGWTRVIMALVVGAGWFAAAAGTRLAQSMGVPASVTKPLRKGTIQAQALTISLAAWLPAALLVWLAAASIDVSVPPVVGMQVFSAATLLGGLTLMPAGVGATGSLAIVNLQSLGYPLVDAVVVVSLVRVASIGVSLVVASVFLAVVLKTLGASVRTDSAGHFDVIGAEYRQQFSTHIWDHLLARKTGLVTAALPSPASLSGIGLDLGCGLGLQCLAMQQRGYRVAGLDESHSLLQHASKNGVPVARGSALALPFRDGSLDFAYAVGVMHHLPGPEAQRAANREVARALKPGGLFLVHETNPRNPLFRFYMGYLFPIFKSIDQGTEWWIEPGHWRSVTGMKLVDIFYFTFLPDFIPRYLMRPFLAIERRLETSPLRPYSVHYMAVLQKEPK